MPASDQDPAVSVCFTVEIDDRSLGSFTSCEGLGCEVVMEQREEGGNNSFVWQLPTRIRYGTIRLSRPLCADTVQITRWFAALGTGAGAGTAKICARTADGREVASWSLTGVVPVRWRGPRLNLDSPQVATETLEIAHHGFLPQ